MKDHFKAFGLVCFWMLIFGAVLGVSLGMVYLTDHYPVIAIIIGGLFTFGVFYMLALGVVKDKRYR